MKQIRSEKSMHQSSTSSKISKILRAGFLAAAGVIILVNAFQLSRELRQQRTPFFSGVKFSGLETVFRNVDRVGYWTDRDLSADRTIAAFEQAQLILAPVILDVGNIRHRYVLLDCADEKNAWLTMKNAGLRPLKRNPFGLILAENPSADSPISDLKLLMH